MKYYMVSIVTICKRLSMLIGAAVLVLLLFSCSDYLDKEPDTELTMDIAFDNNTKVMQALAYCYSGIPSPTEECCFGLYAADELGDNIVWNRGLADWGYSQEPLILLDGWTPSSNWKGYQIIHTYPKFIRQCQLFQQRVHAIPDESLTSDEVNNMKLECRFLICYYYWKQAMVFGPIPFNPETVISADASDDLFYGKRTPWDEIVNWLDKELLDLSNKLPDRYSQVDKYGRITAIMALTLRANMLLFNASPLVNGNAMYKDYANKDGEKLFPQSYDQDKWVRAAEACKLVVDRAEAAGYALYKEYKDGAIDPFLSCQNLFFTYESAGNKEITFPYTGDAGWSTDSWGNKFITFGWVNYEDIAADHLSGNHGGMGVYQGAVDAFFMRNGLPIDDPNSGYVEKGFSTREEKRSGTNWEGTGKVGGITSRGTFNMYCKREPRFYVDIYFQGAYYKWLGRNLDFRLSKKLENIGGETASPTCYMVRKKNYPDDVGKLTGGANWNWTARPQFLYRLGISYLDYAESVNEAYNDEAHRLEALKYLNQIRERAGVRQYSFTVDNEDYIKIDDTQEAVRKVVRMERRVETFAEGVRFIDIRRWMIAEQIPEMNGPAYGLNTNTLDDSQFFQRTPNATYTRTWDKKMYWAPIPQDEIDKNENLVQAPYWN